MSPVIRKLIDRYLASRAGKTGAGQRDLLFPFNDLLREGGCLHGASRYEADQELRALHEEGLIRLESAPRNPSEILRVRLPLSRAEEFVERYESAGPETLRHRLADLFLEMQSLEIPQTHREHWLGYCQRSSQALRAGKRVPPFDPHALELARTLLESSAKLLNWGGESYLRFASCALFGDSKRLEKMQPALERILHDATKGDCRCLADLGITEAGAGFWIHGPGVLRNPRGSMDFGVLDLPVHVSRSDVMTGTLFSPAQRWLTVENETMLLELAKLHSGTLLLSSGFRGGMANHAVIHTLRQAPTHTELWHFGDTDPKGFDILRHLRESTQRKISSLHMATRPLDGTTPLSATDRQLIERLLKSSMLTDDEKVVLIHQNNAGVKGLFEQESLGHPGSQWPFYPPASG
ncbi:MAG: Wadjet anti-phage system protein JetD domain-containing protein [Terrimicrobiaceae bacterium]